MKEAQVGVVVVGGGLGGLFAALSLCHHYTKTHRKEGLLVRVYEKRTLEQLSLASVGASPRHGERGALSTGDAERGTRCEDGGRESFATTLCTRGLAAMREVSPELVEWVVKNGVWLDSFRWHWSMVEKNGQSQSGALEKPYAGGRLLCIDRRNLLEALYHKCAEDARIELRFGQVLGKQDIEKLSEQCDLVIGADGVNSVTRSILFPHTIYQQGGDSLSWSIRAEASSLQNRVLVEGFRLHYREIVIPYIENVRKASFHLWSPTNGNGGGVRFVLGLCGNPRGMALGIYGESEEILGNNSKTLEALLKNFSHLGSQVLECCRYALEKAGPRTVLGRLSSVSCPSFASVDSKYVLIGDAAHAMVPFHGLGANSALEDGYVLAQILARECFRNIGLSVSKFASARKPQVDIAVQQSLSEAERMASCMIPLRPLSEHNAESVSLYDEIAFSTDDYITILERYRTKLPKEKLVRELRNGLNLRIFVSKGDKIEENQPLCVIESVKTRMIVRAQHAGEVVRIDMDEEDMGPPRFVIDNPSKKARISAVQNPPHCVPSLIDDKPILFDGARFQAELFELGVQHLGKFISYRKVTSSTMEDASREAEHGAPHGTIFLAEQQTKGRGRAGRTWVSQPKGNVYMTLLLRNDSPFGSGVFEKLILATPTAVCLAIRRLGVSNAFVKWPNDIWVTSNGGRKLSGMLIESLHNGDLIMVGIGINANEKMSLKSEASQESSLARIATSIRDELGGVQIEREILMAQLCFHLERLLALDDDSRLKEFTEVNMLAGEYISVLRKSDQIVLYDAKVIGATPDGGLRVALDSNQEQILQPQEGVSVRAISKARKRDVVVYRGPGADPRCVKMTLHTLNSILQGKGYNVFPVDEDFFCASRDWESQTALVVMPGGADRFMKIALGFQGVARIKQYCEEMDGKYLGFCAGAYFACAMIEFDKDGPLEVVETRDLGFFDGVARGPVLEGFDYASPKGAWCVALDVADEKPWRAFSYFNGGCSFHPHSNNATAWPSNVTIIGRYAVSDFTKDNPAAIIKCSVESSGGIVLLCGAHPEFDPDPKVWETSASLSPSLKSPYTNTSPHIHGLKSVHDALLEHNDSRIALLRYLIFHHLDL